MKALRFVIIGVILLGAVGFRLWRRRRGAGSAPAPLLAARLARLLPHPAGREIRGDVALVAAREVRERLRGRVFRIGTAVILLAVAAAVVIPVLHKSGRSTERVGVVGALSAPLQASIVALGPRLGTTVVLTDEASVAAAESDLRSGHVTAVLVGTSRLIVKKAIGAGDTSSGALLVRSIASTVSLQAGLQDSGLSAQQAEQLVHAPPLPVQSLQQAAASPRNRSTAIYGLILTFVLLSQYGTWILMGVIEEKSSRVVEVLLAALRPWQLLAGKVIGIGTMALGQATLIVGVALGLGAAVGSELLHAGAPAVVFASLVWLLLGYAFYCWVYAAAGSMATRQEHVQTLAFPLQLPLLLGYISSITSLGSSTPSLFIKVLAYLPPTAPFGMPVLVADGRATWWEFTLSAAISVAATIGVSRVAAAIYLRAILRTGTRVRLREIVGKRATVAAGTT